MAPEMLKGFPYTTSVDVYSFAVILFFETIMKLQIVLWEIFAQ